MKQDYKLDVVIPIRTREEYNIFDRLLLRKSYDLPKNVRFMIVDDGSIKSDSDKIKKICKDNGFSYFYIDSGSEMFNLSRARNFAIKNSDADYLMFEDIDLISHKSFYHWINTQIDNLLIMGKWEFFNIPVTYLSEQGSEEINSSLSDTEYDKFVSEIYNAKNSDLVEYHAPASSYLVCSRQTAIRVGGYDEAFEGWGFEDSDFAVKLLINANIDKPRELYRLDTREYSNQVQWRGWRALYRVYADIVAFKGIYSFHKWHKIATHRSVSVRQKNHKIYKENVDRYFKSKDCFLPLYDKNREATLFTTKNPHAYNPDIFQAFGNSIYIDEVDININEISSIIKNYNIKNVVTMNPYANTRRKLIHDKFKELGVSTYVIERGALPWSIYVDKEGFCAESSSYDESNWRKEISEEEVKITEDYINELKTSGASLEPQADLIGGRNLKKKLVGNSENKKLLFVAFQSPSDTTTNFFCGDVKSYDNFVYEISKLPILLEDTEWTVIYKNHPLTIDKVNIEGAVCVDAYHIGDILEAADAVTLINSGVGLISSIYSKPVYYFGQAFYANDSFNRKVTSSEELVDYILNNNLVVDKEKLIYFVNYLIHDFYCFAHWRRAERSHTDQAKMSISLDIKYHEVRIKSLNVNKIINRDNDKNLFDSILFDRYRLDDYIYKKENNKPNVKKVNVTKNIVNNPKPNEKSVKDVTSVPGDNKKSPSDKDNKTHVIKNTKMRKINKLFRNPSLFFRDFFDKRINS